MTQLRRSKVVAVLALTVVISLLVRPWTAAEALDYVTFGALFFLVALVMAAVGTALHESSHIAKLAALGFEVEDFVVHRIGNISFRISGYERMTPDDVYEVAKAPFVRPVQYAVEAANLSVLTLITWLSPFPLDIVLLVFLVLIAVVVLADLCALRVIRSRLTDGPCVALASTVTSREDIQDIVEWNMRQAATDYAEGVEEASENG